MSSTGENIKSDLVMPHVHYAYQLTIIVQNILQLNIEIRRI